MSDVEEPKKPVRTTRSGRAVKSAQKTKTVSASPKGGRKTRKKVVVMEVEVSDEEDTIETGEPDQKKAKIEEEKPEEVDEDELLKSDEESETKEAEVPVKNELTALEEIIQANEKICEQVQQVEESEKNGKIDEEEPPKKEEEDEKPQPPEPQPQEPQPPEPEPQEPMDSTENGVEDSKPQNGEPEAENISDEELPTVTVPKVPETEEVSDEDLPGPKRAELPADTEVVSEDELPAAKKEAEDDDKKKDGNKRKLSEGAAEEAEKVEGGEAPPKKSKDEKEVEKKPKKLPELDKYWKAVNDDPTDFTGWTYLLQYVDQENDMEAAREAYDAFLSHYPYCYGYWRKYADYEKRKGNKKKCEEVFERGLKAIPLSVDLWIHYLTHVKSTKGEDEEFVRSQFERALSSCGLEFRSDRLWDSYIKWEIESKRLQRATMLYDRLLATPTQSYTAHFDSFQEHIAANPPNKVLEVDEFLALRKEVRNTLKNDDKGDAGDLPPGDEDSKLYTSDEETKCIRERIVSIRRKVHKGTVAAVTARWNFEEGIKRPYFHVKPLERCQLKNWQDYLDYEFEQGDRNRIIVLFERCLIACALYEEFWLKFVNYLESLKDDELQTKIRDVYERACTIHHLKRPNLHMQWAMFEENAGNINRAAEILVNLEKQVPNVLQVAYRRINLERRRQDYEKCTQLFEHYISSFKNKVVASNVAIKFSRFCLKVLKDFDKSVEVLKTAITKDPNNPRLYLQLIDLTLQKPDVKADEICLIIDEFLEKDSAEPDQKTLFAQRKLEFLEDFGSDVQSVKAAHDQCLKYIKTSKENSKKKDSKPDSTTTVTKKDKNTTSSAPSYNNYSYSSTSQPPFNYAGNTQGQYNYQYQGGDQYQYQNWQYPQAGGYGGYNQWSGYTGGYGY